MTAGPTIYVVDDDPAVLKAVASAVGLLGFPVRGYASAAEFLAGYRPEQPGCLILDLKLPGMTGLELQRKLADENIAIPVIMISAHADVRITVEAMTLGAVTLLEKPFSLEELLSHARKAIERDAAARAARRQSDSVRSKLEALTDKEREVLDLIVAGHTNREIADRLGLSVRAIEDRRGRLMRKLEVESLAELIALVNRIEE